MSSNSISYYSEALASFPSNTQIGINYATDAICASKKITDEKEVEKIKLYLLKKYARNLSVSELISEM